MDSPEGLLQCLREPVAEGLREGEGEQAGQGRDAAHDEHRRRQPEHLGMEEVKSRAHQHHLKSSQVKSSHHHP